MSLHPGYQQFTRSQFERSARTTLANHLREVEEAHMRNYQMGAILEAAGRVTYNHGGEGIDWPVRFRNHPVEGNTGETPRTYQRINLWKTAKLDWRGYQTTDLIYNRELLANRGPEGIIKVWDGFMDRLKDSMKYATSSQYFIDGEDVNHANLWCGLNTMFQVNGTVNYTTGAQRSANNADYVYYPSGEYAGIKLDLGYYGGANETGAIWPEGTADTEYDFWTGIHVNWTSERFAADVSDLFTDKGEEAMRFGILAVQRNGGQENQLTNIWLARNLYGQLLKKQDNRQEIMVESEYSLRKLGFRNVIHFDGVEVSWEAAVPHNTGFGIGYDCCDLMNMYPEMFHPEGPEYDMDEQAYKAVVSNLGNLKFKSPRNVLKLQNVV